MPQLWHQARTQSAQMTDGFGSLDEITTACEIHGCHVRVLDDFRCTTHGGHPQVEVATDMWGKTTYSFHTEEQREETTE